MQQRTVETFGGQPGGAELVLDACIARDDGRLIATVPDDGVGTGFLGEREQLLMAVAATQNQP